jgi:hypothetical protein
MFTMLEQASVSPTPKGLHPLAQERMVAIGNLWYYENIYTGKKRRFPKSDDWDDDPIHTAVKKLKQKPITQLVLITANLECDCGKLMKFKHHYADPVNKRSSRKCDQIYVYFCPTCVLEVELTYLQLEEKILTNTKRI